MKKIISTLAISALASLTVLGQLQVSINGSSSFCPGGQTCLTAVATGGMAPYSFLWSDGTTSATDCILIAGFYSVTVTDALMDTASAWMVITQFPAPVIVVSPPNPSICGPGCVGLTTSGALNYTWMPLFSGLNCYNCPNPFACPNVTTTYTVTGSDGNGCTGSASVTVTFNPPDTAFASPGHICSGDSSVLYTTGGTDYLWSTGDTTSSITVWPTSYATYSVTIYNTITGCTETAYMHVHVGFTEGIYTNDQFIPLGSTATLSASGGTQYIWSTGDTTSTINVAPLTTTTYWVTISEPPLSCVGTDSITIFVGMPRAGYVYWDLNGNNIADPGEPPAPNKVISEQPVNYFFLSDSSGIYTAYYDSGFYSLQLLYPGTYCIASPPVHTLTGLNDTTNDFGIYCPPVLDVAVLVSQGCLKPDSNTYFELCYHNPGTTTASGSVHMVYDTLLNFLSATPPPDFQFGDSLSWNYSNLSPGSGSCIWVEFYVPLTAILGDTVPGRVSIDPVIGDTLPTNNIVNFVRIIGSPWDPNNKEVSDAYLTEQEVATKPTLYYTIHFQNTGTAPAQQVVIRDVLGPELIIPSIQMVASSHACNFSLDSSGTAIWTFDNIMLPDSGTDYLGSMGYVVFSIRAKQTLTEGDTIKNDAAIYFDLNPPVITNDATTAITGVVGMADVLNPAGSSLEVFPNPASEQLSVIYNGTGKGTIQILLFDLQGRTLFTSGDIQCDGRYSRSLDIRVIPGGVYFIRLLTESYVLSKKVVVVKD